MAALSGKPPALGPARKTAAPQPAPASVPEPSTPGNPSLPEGVERVLEGIGDGLGKGLKSLFGQ